MVIFASSAASEEGKVGVVCNGSHLHAQVDKESVMSPGSSEHRLVKFVVSHVTWRCHGKQTHSKHF